MTNSLVVVVVALILDLFIPIEAFAQSSSTPEELVLQLAAPSFRERERATARLVALGRAAVPALEAGCKGADLETVRRCEFILKSARRTDLEIRVDDFAADIEGKKNIKLAGWERFRKLAGDDPASREAFADMYKTAGDIWELLETDKAAAVVKISARLEAVRQRQYLVSKGPVSFTFNEGVAAVLLATDRRITLPRNDVITAFSIFGYARTTGSWSLPAVSKLFKGLIDETDKPELAVSLISVGRSFSLPGFDDDGIKTAILRLVPSVEANSAEAKPEQVSIQFFLIFGEQSNLKEIVPLAKRVLKNKSIDPYNHVIAMQLLAKVGGDAAIPAIEESLTDGREMGRITTRVGAAGELTVTHKVSDTALAALLMLTKQTPNDYGFPLMNACPGIHITLGTAADGFCDEAGRNAAIQKWRYWVAMNRAK